MYIYIHTYICIYRGRGRQRLVCRDAFGPLCLVISCVSLLVGVEVVVVVVVSLLVVYCLYHVHYMLWVVLLFISLSALNICCLFVGEAFGPLSSSQRPMPQAPFKAVLVSMPQSPMPHFFAEASAASHILYCFRVNAASPIRGSRAPCPGGLTEAPASLTLNVCNGLTPGVLASLGFLGMCSDAYVQSSRGQMGLIKSNDYSWTRKRDRSPFIPTPFGLFGSSSRCSRAALVSPPQAKVCIALQCMASSSCARRAARMCACALSRL